VRLISTYLDYLRSYFLYEPVNPSIIILKITLFVSLFILCIWLAYRLLSSLSVGFRLHNAKYRSQLNWVKPVLKVKYKSALLLLIDEKLKRNGRPMGLTAKKYVSYKISLILLIATSTRFTSIKIPVIVMFGLAAFFLVDLLLIIDSRDNKIRIDEDMPIILNNLYMQLEAKVPFVECISTLHMSAENSKLLKAGLKEFSIRFAMNDFDIDAACNELEKKFSNVSLSILLMAFRQYKDSGKMKEILKRQYELHLKKEEEMLEASSNSILKMAAVSTILIGINCILMIVYPMYVSMTENMYNVMK